MLKYKLFVNIIILQKGVYNMLKKAFIIFLIFLSYVLNAQEEAVSEKISYSQSEWEPLIFIQNQNYSQSL